MSNIETLQAWIEMAKRGNEGAVKLLRSCVKRASEEAPDIAIILLAEEMAAIYRDDMNAIAESN